jgi:hypothetical protein
VVIESRGGAFKIDSLAAELIVAVDRSEKDSGAGAGLRSKGNGNGGEGGEESDRRE